MRILPFGDRAILAEFDSLHETMSAFHRLERARIRGVHELVPAASTVLVRIEPTLLSLRAAEEWVVLALDGGECADGDSQSPQSVTIRMRYDGPDLASVAEILGLSVPELVSRHSQAEWQCAFIGFAPGFAYLVSDEVDLGAPRRETSRASVPAGSVGLAGEFTGVYPRRSPGGWQLIGTTDATLWDPTRQTPATIVPGATVRFEVVTG